MAFTPRLLAVALCYQKAKSSVRNVVMAYAVQISIREMAKTIRQASFLPKAVTDANNPFFPFYAYNKAVAKFANRHPVFLEASIAVLKSLEAQLIQSR